MRLFIAIVLFVFLPSNLFGQSQLQRQLNGFSIRSKYTNQINSQEFRDFFFITESQKKEFEELEKKYYDLADSCKSDKSLSSKEKLDRLKELKKEKENHFLNDILNKRQRSQLEGWKHFKIIRFQGVANSMVNGVIARGFELTMDERAKLKVATDSAFKKYQEKVVKAQIDAIRDITKTLPVEKRKKIQSFLNGITLPDGHYWKINDHHLNARDDQRVRQDMGLPKLNFKK